ncbi:amine oxidase [Mycena floridula]|nr:amine oxidase [Mycena floridula]
MRYLIQIAVFLTAVDSKHTVLVLGGGVTGVIAARTLYQHARRELGGRMQSHNSSGHTIERGPNWIQGTQTGNAPMNPSLGLARKWGVKTQFNDIYGHIKMSHRALATYDSKGAVDYMYVFKKSLDDFENLAIGAGARINRDLVDGTARAGYSLAGAKPKSHHARAAEYYQYDFEAEDFLGSDQVMLGSTVREIRYSSDGVKVVLTNNKTISGNYALCTFSLGVLQNDDVKFHLTLPVCKQEAIESMIGVTMATYTKIFVGFPKKFWFDTEMGIYADSERGIYPVWQSLDHTSSIPNSGILFVTVTGDYSVRIETMSDSQVQAEVMDVLRDMFPHVAIPAPIDFYFAQWHSNPLFRGSYSNWPASFLPQHHENLRANVDRLFFAGEATSLWYYGFLHGAYFEGLSVATVMANCMKLDDRSCENTCPYNLTGPL